MIAEMNVQFGDDKKLAPFLFVSNSLHLCCEKNMNTKSLTNAS